MCLFQKWTAMNSRYMLIFAMFYSRLKAVLKFIQSEYLYNFFTIKTSVIEISTFKLFDMLNVKTSIWMSSDYPQLLIKVMTALVGLVSSLFSPASLNAGAVDASWKNVLHQDLKTTGTCIRSNSACKKFWPFLMRTGINNGRMILPMVIQWWAHVWNGLLMSKDLEERIIQA